MKEDIYEGNWGMDWQADDQTIHMNCVVFCKVTEEFGGLSNMAGGYPLSVNDMLIFSSEALYQACRFPHQPDWQLEIIRQRSPMAAKMKARKGGRRDRHSRPDWSQVSVDIMCWVLRVKLAQHYRAIVGLLHATGTRAIVEQSRKDRIWGAVEERGLLRGQNQLGQLLMELRGLVETLPQEQLLVVEPLAVPNFLLLGKGV